MILLCKMLIINCQTCFNLWGAVNTAVPPSQNFGGDSSSLFDLIAKTMGLGGALVSRCLSTRGRRFDPRSSRQVATLDKLLSHRSL